MRVAIDAHAIGKRQTGNEVYVRSLLQQFVRIDPAAEFYAYLSSPTAMEQIPARVQRRYVSSNPFVRLGFQLGYQIAKDTPDLLHVQYTAPLHCRIPIVVTVHDVSFLEHPEFFSPFRQRQLAFTVERTVRAASRILTCSEFSRHAIASAYNLDPDTVRVAHNAASPTFRPIDRRAAKADLERLYQIRSPFLLCVGNLQKRKNQIGLIRAYESLVQAHPEYGQHLVLVGKDTAQSAEIRAVAKRSAVRDRIHFTGFVPDEALPAFYNACDLFVFPSFYEGFGIPLLEAMACGCPIACSNRTALPEVAGRTAVLFDPASTASIAQSLHDVLANLDFCQRLGDAALERSRIFHWENTARTILDVYREVAGEPIPLELGSAPRAVASGS